MLFYHQIVADIFTISIDREKIVSIFEICLQFFKKGPSLY